jgi:hypothetical protein
MEGLERPLGDFSSGIRQLNHLHEVCTPMADSAVARTRVRSPSSLSPRIQSQQRLEYRSMNTAMFGVTEDLVVNVWWQNVDQALRYVTDQTINVVDAFRICWFDAKKMKPNIVKLHTPLDKRIILANCSKLKDFCDRIYILPEGRRKKTFEMPGGTGRESVFS